MLAGDFSFGSEIMVQHNQNGGDDTENHPKSNHNGITHTYGKRGGSSKEGGFAIVFGKGGDKVVFIHVVRTMK